MGVEVSSKGDARTIRIATPTRTHDVEWLDGRSEPAYRWLLAAVDREAAGLPAASALA